MDDMEFDRTRKAIGADRLGGKDRKEMMQRLQDAGGKVLSEKALKKEEPGGGGGGKGSAGRGSSPDMLLPSQIAREKRRLELEQQNRIRKMMEQEERDATSLVSRFFLRLRCKMKGITPFGQDIITPQFMSILNLNLKRAVMEAHILGNDLFMSDPAVGSNIVRELDEINPLFAELLERAVRLYDRYELSDLTGAYSSSPETPVLLSDIRRPLFTLLRKLYYLKPYAEVYLTAAERAIDIQQKLEKKSGNIYAAKKKKIRAEWKALMGDIYESLVLVAQRIDMKKADPGSRLFEDMLEIRQEDKIGQRRKGDMLGGATPAQTEQAAAETKEGEEKPAETADEGVAEGMEGAEMQEEILPNSDLAFGLRLLRSMSPFQLRKKADPRGEMAGFSIRDKVFLSYLYLHEFDNEYSLILTTPKVKMNAFYRGGLKVDYRRQLSDHVDTMRPLHDMFKNYVHENQEYLKALEERDRVHNYVEFAKRISLMESRRGGSGRQVRVLIKEWSDRVAATLKALLDDIHGERRIVENGDDIFKFDMPTETRKRMADKTISECIHEAYCFLMALSYRIEHGDLYGGVIEMSDEAFRNAFGVSGGTPVATGSSGGDSPAESGNAMEERRGDTTSAGETGDSPGEIRLPDGEETEF